jgi:uncharacterized protein involved in exopolysaccharide biosynthesis/Mrp family chromosome partitioning ATPase
MVNNEAKAGISERSIQDFVYVIFRHKRKLATFSLAFLMTVTLGTLLLPSIYRSEAKLLVGLGRENVTLDPTATTGRVVDVERSRQSEINSEIEILKSRDLAGMVVDSIGPGVLIKQDQIEDGNASSSSRTIGGEIRSIKKKILSVFTPSSEAAKPKGKSESLKEREEAIQDLMQNLTVAGSKESNVIALSYEGQVPKLAQEVISKYIQFYLDKHIKVHRTAGSYEFFIQQTERLRDALSQTAKDLRDLKNKTGTVSVDEQRRIILNWIGALQQEMEQTDAAVAVSKAKVTMMRQHLAGLPQTLVTGTVSGFPNQAADRMRERLYELQLKEQDLLSKFTENSLPVIEIRRQIKEAKALMTTEERTLTQVTQGVNLSYQQLQYALLTEEATLSSLEAKAQVLREQLSRAQGELKDLNENEVHLKQLQREMNIQEDLYRKNAESLEQARIDHALEMDKISSINVLEPATYPVKPVRPNRMLNVALGLVLSLFGGIVLAFASQYADHSLKTPGELLGKLQLQTLATIPFSDSQEVPVVSEKGSDEKQSAAEDGETTSCEAQFLSLREREPGPHHSAKLGSWEAQFLASRNQEELKPAHIVNAGKDTPGKWRMPIETRVLYGYFRDRLLMAAAGSLESPYAFGLTSCQPGEGVSSIATNLAGALAQHYEGGGVLLLSAEAVDNSRGDDFNLYAKSLFLPKKNVFNLQEEYKSRGLSKLLEQLKERYRFVVFDLPAIQEASSVVELSRMVDGLILVVEAERVSREEAKRAVELLTHARANLLGAVLNKKRTYVPEWLSRRL